MDYSPVNNIDDDIDWIHNSVSYSKRYTDYRLSVWPRKCSSSKKNIWFKYAYRVRHSFHGWYDHHDEDRWYDKHEYVKLKLMG